MSVPGPALGPCAAWIDGADVLACCSGAGVGSDAAQLEYAAIEASMALFEISGRLYPGLCSRTVRPCHTGCSCWGPRSPSSGTWLWSPTIGSYGAWFCEDSGQHCGCSPIPTVKLAGYPVREIIEVLIDDEVVDPATYRLDHWRDLVRLGGLSWPACQDMSLNSGEGTFIVDYRWGTDPPALGVAAAAALACQLYLACSGGECQLPQGATRITRQGVTIERSILDPSKPTGIVPLDLFLRAYGRPGRMTAVWSPDVPAYAQPVGD